MKIENRKFLNNKQFSDKFYAVVPTHLSTKHSSPLPPVSPFLSISLLPRIYSQYNPSLQLLCIIVSNAADVDKFKNYSPTEDSLRGDAYPAQILSAIKETQGPAASAPAPAPAAPAGNYPSHTQGTLLTIFEDIFLSMSLNFIFSESFLNLMPKCQPTQFGSSREQCIREQAS